MQKYHQLDSLLGWLPTAQIQINKSLHGTYMEEFRDADGNFQWVEIDHIFVAGATKIAHHLGQEIATVLVRHKDGSYENRPVPEGVQLVNELLEKHGLRRHQEETGDY